MICVFFLERSPIAICCFTITTVHRINPAAPATITALVNRATSGKDRKRSNHIAIAVHGKYPLQELLPQQVEAKLVLPYHLRGAGRAVEIVQISGRSLSPCIELWLLCVPHDIALEQLCQLSFYR